MAVGVLACLVLLQVLFPYRLQRAGAAALESPFRSLSVGALALFAAAASAAALYLLTHQLVFSLFPLLVAALPAFPGLTAVLGILGRRLLPTGWQRNGDAPATIVGVALWEAALLVPIVGWLIGLGVVAWGAGAFLCSMRDPYAALPRERVEEEIPSAR